MTSSRTQPVVLAASLLGPAAAFFLAYRSLDCGLGGCSAEDAATGDLILAAAIACLLLAPVVAGLVLRSVGAAGATVLGEVLVMALAAFVVYVVTL